MSSDAEIADAFLELNREVQDELDSSKVVHIMKKALRSAVEEQLGAFSVSVENITALYNDPLFVQTFALTDEVIDELIDC
jgi:hypothetical protein